MNHLGLKFDFIPNLKMNVDDLIHYVSEETLLIGSQLKSRAFLLIGLRHVAHTFVKNISQFKKLNFANELLNSSKFKKLNFDNELLSLYQLILNYDCRYYRNDGLYGACFGGHQDLAKWMIEKGANKWNYGLHGACEGGHKDLVELMISKGADNWNHGFHGACEGGHKDLAELMIEKGADDWNWGLSAACRGGQKNLVEWMISKGVNQCFNCSKTMAEHLI